MDIKETIVKEAYEAAYGIAPRFSSLDAVGSVLNDEDAQLRILAYLATRGYDPRDVLDVVWLCKACGHYIPYNEQARGYAFECESCARDFVD